MRQRKRDSFLNKIIIVLVILIILIIGILIYNTSHYGYSIELIGGNDITIYLNDYYQELGYKAYNRNGEDVTYKVNVNGKVDTSKEGTYEITYQIGGVKEIRKVSVIYDIRNDLTLTLVGDNPKYILKDVTYSFDDCKAYDKNQGDITSKIVVDSNVNFNEEGEYEVEYSIVNSKGIKKSITQKVIVYDIDYVLKENMVNNKQVVEISFDETYYQKVKFPDGTFSLSSSVECTFVENGEYILEVYDRYNNIKKINIVVSKIDKIPPTGTCVVNLYDNNSKIVVKANDNQTIKGYTYYYGNKKSDLLTNSEFTYTDMVSNTKVTVYDMANNSVSVNCQVNDLSTRYTRSYTTENNGFNYKLYIPGNITKRSSVPLVVFLHGMGECGSNPDLVNANSFPKYISEGADYNFIMVAPQIPNGKCGSKYFVPSTIKTIIDGVVNKYPVARDRIIITGFSLGGINTYSMIKAYPTFFAAAIPLSGATSYDDSLLLTNIWGHNGNQNDGAYYEHKALLQKISAKNPKSKFTEYPAGHNITALVYKDQAVIDYIMKARRNY